MVSKVREAIFRLHSHDTKDKESSNSELLAKSQAQLEDLDDGQDQDDNIHQEMGQAGAEEELGIIDVAASSLDVVVPVCLHRNAFEDDHEGSKDEPDSGDAEEDLDGDSNRRVLEDPPVEQQNRRL